MSAVISDMTLVYTPGGGDAVLLCACGQALPAAPEAEWELPTQTHDRIGARWGADCPAGNARLRLSMVQVLREPTLGQLVRRMRHVEMEGNMHREGSLLWQEAVVDGIPAYEVRWRALVTGCRARRLEAEEIPGDQPGYWACLEWDFVLTEPEEL